jgi:hypothetical protein
MGGHNKTHACLQDCAELNVARVLRDVPPRTAVAGRLGGFQWTAFLSSSDDSFLKVLHPRLPGFSITWRLVPIDQTVMVIVSRW